MLLALLFGLAGLTWFIDKSYGGGGDLVTKEGKSIKQTKDGNYPNLGFKKELSKNIPWGASRTRRIGDWSIKNPLPLVDPLPGGENTRVTDNKRQAIPKNQKNNFKKLVHEKYNLEEYFRFDQYLGGKYKDIMPTQRRSTIAYRY